MRSSGKTTITVVSRLTGYRYRPVMSLTVRRLAVFAGVPPRRPPPPRWRRRTLRLSICSPVQKPTLSFRQIWNMSFGFLGIRFGFGLQLANMSAIYTKLGAKPEELPFLWLAGPMTGLLVQPLIGSLSGRTWTRLGRRRPYFLVGAIPSSIALWFMPDAPIVQIAATMLWVLDASVNISMEPFRAFVADKLNSDQCTAGFVMQSFFIGCGAAVANALPAILKHSGVA